MQQLKVRTKATVFHVGKISLGQRPNPSARARRGSPWGVVPSSAYNNRSLT